MALTREDKKTFCKRCQAYTGSYYINIPTLDEREEHCDACGKFKSASPMWDFVPHRRTIREQLNALIARARGNRAVLWASVALSAMGILAGIIIFLWLANHRYEITSTAVWFLFPFRWCVFPVSLFLMKIGFRAVLDLGFFPEDNKEEQTWKT